MLTILLLACLAGGCTNADTNYYAIETPKGTMIIRLYDETPEHRDNFKKLAAEGFYDGTTFHRVIQNFMIQGGDPNSKDGDPSNDGQGGPGYTLPAEFVPGKLHKRGALAAARQGDVVNPEKRSSGSQFYIVQGQAFDDATLEQMEAQGITMDEAAKGVYRTEGGVPWLDGEYTVFGELVDGFDVLAAIASATTPNAEGRPAPPPVADQPVDPIPMTVRPAPEYSE